jgi:hypothetical protein
MESDAIYREFSPPIWQRASSNGDYLKEALLEENGS